MKYINIFLLILLTFSCSKSSDSEEYSRAYFRIVTTSLNNCGYILYIDNVEEGITYSTAPVNPPDSIYNGLELHIQYVLLADSFNCHISGPIIGTDVDRDKSFVKAEILKIRD